MESSIAEFLKRQLACELLPTTSITPMTSMSMTNVWFAATNQTKLADSSNLTKLVP